MISARFGASLCTGTPVILGERLGIKRGSSNSFSALAAHGSTNCAVWMLKEISIKMPYLLLYKVTGNQVITSCPPILRVCNITYLTLIGSLVQSRGVKGSVMPSAITRSDHPSKKDVQQRLRMVDWPTTIAGVNKCTSSVACTGLTWWSVHWNDCNNHKPCESAFCDQ